MLRTVQRMVGASPDLVNAKDGHGATPLMYASMKGSVQVCTLHSFEGGRSVICCFCRFVVSYWNMEQMSTVRTACVNGQPSCRPSIMGEWTAIMQAVHHG